MSLVHQFTQKFIARLPAIDVPAYALSLSKEVRVRVRIVENSLEFVEQDDGDDGVEE